MRDLWKQDVCDHTTCFLWFTLTDPLSRSRLAPDTFLLLEEPKNLLLPQSSINVWASCLLIPFLFTVLWVCEHRFGSVQSRHHQFMRNYDVPDIIAWTVWRTLKPHKINYIRRHARCLLESLVITTPCARDGSSETPCVRKRQLSFIIVNIFCLPLFLAFIGLILWPYKLVCY